jgi:hypothetical protein
VRGFQAQLLHQDVCGGGQQDTKLVRPEVAATGAIDLKIVQFFYPILDLAPLAVHLFIEPCMVRRVIASEMNDVKKRSASMYATYL